MTRQPAPPAQPQDALGELAQITLANSSLATVMDKVAQLTKRDVPGATEVSVTLIERGRPSTVAFTGALAASVDETQYAHGYGPCLDCIAAGETVRIDQMSTETRWPGYTPRPGAGACAAA